MYMPWILSSVAQSHGNINTNSNKSKTLPQKMKDNLFLEQ